jgi:hypothetical protein
MAVSRQIDFLLAGLIDSNGMPLSGGKVFTYDAGTLTAKTTWTDLNKTSPASNPIILDSLGQAKIFGDGAYKFIIKRADDTTLTTLDNIIINEQAASLFAGTTTGTGTAYVLTYTPSPTSYSNGLAIQFLAHASNGASPTINVNSLGAVPLYRPNQTAIPTSVLRTTILYTAIYYNGAFIVQDCSTPWTDFSGGAATTGFAVAPAGGIYRYRIDSSGTVCSVEITQPNNGTSGDIVFTIAAPISASTAVANRVSYAPLKYTNNGTDSTTPGMVSISAGTPGSFKLDTSWTGTGWTNVNGKKGSFSISYEI